MVPPASTPHSLSAAKRKRRIRTPSRWIHYEMRDDIVNEKSK
jgi:hypothetical protein